MTRASWLTRAALVAALGLAALPGAAHAAKCSTVPRSAIDSEDVPRNVSLGTPLRGATSCRTARAVAIATAEQYYLQGDEGTTYSIDPYTPGPRIWSCDMRVRRSGRDDYVDVDCWRGRQAVSMTWRWRNVWIDG